MHAAFKLIPVDVKIMMGSPAAKWLRKSVKSATGSTTVGHACLISGGVHTNRNVQAEVKNWECRGDTFIEVGVQAVRLKLRPLAAVRLPLAL